MIVRVLLFLPIILTIHSPSVLAIGGEENSEEEPEKSTLEYYDGRWEFGLGLEFTKIQKADLSSGEDVLDVNLGFIIGKDFYRNDNISFGGQLHLSRTISDDPNSLDDVTKNSTVLFATAHFHKAPFLKFKLGITHGDITDIFGKRSGTGLAYGVDLVFKQWGGLQSAVLKQKSGFLTALSYEVGEIGDDKYSMWFLNVLMFAY